MLRLTEKEFVHSLGSIHLAIDEEFDEELALRRFCDIIASMVNSFGFHKDEVLDMICSDENAKANFTALCICWLKVLDKQYKSNRFDGRNEYSCKIGNALMGLSDFRAECAALESTLQWKKAGDAVDILSREHRTLQQTFSGLVFKFVALNFSNADIRNNADFIRQHPLLKNDTDFRWWQTPMI